MSLASLSITISRCLALAIVAVIAAAAPISQSALTPTPTSTLTLTPTVLLMNDCFAFTPSAAPAAVSLTSVSASPSPSPSDEHSVSQPISISIAHPVESELKPESQSQSQSPSSFDPFFVYTLHDGSPLHVDLSKVFFTSAAEAMHLIDLDADEVRSNVLSPLYEVLTRIEYDDELYQRTLDDQREIHRLMADIERRLRMLEAYEFEQRLRELHAQSQSLSQSSSDHADSHVGSGVGRSRSQHDIDELAFYRFSLAEQMGVLIQSEEDGRGGFLIRSHWGNHSIDYQQFTDQRQKLWDDHLIALNVYTDVCIQAMDASEHLCRFIGAKREQAIRDRPRRATLSLAVEMKRQQQHQQQQQQQQQRWQRMKLLRPPQAHAGTAFMSPVRHANAHRQTHRRAHAHRLYTFNRDRMRNPFRNRLVHLTRTQLPIAHAYVQHAHVHV